MAALLGIFLISRLNSEAVSPISYQLHIPSVIKRLICFFKELQDFCTHFPQQFQITPPISQLWPLWRFIQILQDFYFEDFKDQPVDWQGKSSYNDEYLLADEKTTTTKSGRSVIACVFQPLRRKVVVGSLAFQPQTLFCLKKNIFVCQFI